MIYYTNEKMVNYSCEKCGKEFSQKGNYTKHATKKISCGFESKLEEIIQNVSATKTTDEIRINEILILEVFIIHLKNLGGIVLCLAL